MATTAVFAEILIVGILALIWVFLGAIGLGLRQADLSALKGWEPAVTVTALAVAYALGILVDRTADYLQERATKRLWATYRPDGEPKELGESELRLRVAGKAPEAVLAFLDYSRSRRRICRALVLNGALTVTVALADLSLAPRVPRSVLLVTISVATLVMLLGFWTWRDLGVMYHRRLRQAYRIFVLDVPAPILDLAEPFHK